MEKAEVLTMSGQKKGMWVVFKMKKMPGKEEMRKRFCELYHIYRDHPGIDSKCWWVNEERREWGAFYLFESEEVLQAYLKSDLWVKEIPERWGLKPEFTIVDPGPILCKEIVTRPENSWVTD
jgi:hypothetical protein